MTRSFEKFIGILAFIALTACQTNPDWTQKPGRSVSSAKSMAEAKNITANFRNTLLIPPRNISDITEFLSLYKRKDEAVLNRLRREADNFPPATKDIGDLASFYFKRGTAASHLGRGKQAIQDNRMAADLAIQDNPGSSLARMATHNYALEELLYGNYGKGVKGMEESLSISTSEGAQLARQILLAGLYASGGEIGKAEKYLAISGRNLDELHNWAPLSKKSMEVLFGNARAVVLAAKGNTAEAEMLLRKIIENWRPFRNKDMSASGLDSKTAGRMHIYFLLNLGRLLLDQGRYVEAETIAREAVLSVILLYGRYSSHTARALNLLTLSIFNQGRFAEAAQLAEESIDVLTRGGNTTNSKSLAIARKLQADIWASEGLWKKAIQVYSQIKKDMANDQSTYEQYLASNSNWILAYLKVGKIAEAKILAKENYLRNLRRFGKKHYQTALDLGFIALIKTLADEKRAAIADFRAVVPILMSRSRQINSDKTSKAMQDRHVTSILESYLWLLTDIQGTSLEHEAGIDALGEAFFIANTLRSRAVQRALVASSARAALSDPNLSNLARREQDAQKHLENLWGLLTLVMSRPNTQENTAQIKTIRTQIDEFRSSRALLMKVIEERFPEYAQLINPKPPRIKQAQSTLAYDEALVSTYVGQDRTYVWAIPHTGEVAFSSINIGLEDIEDSVSSLRAALNPSAGTLGDIPEFDVAEAYSLYEKLLKPVEAGWKRAKSLLVVGHGPLGYLPLSLLPTESISLVAETGPLFSEYRDVPWLVRSHAVTMLPSVASLLALRELPAGKPERKAFIGFGDPWFNNKQAVEARSVAFKTTKVGALVSRGLKTSRLPVRLRAAPATSELDSAELGDLPRLPDTADELRAMARALKANSTQDLFLGDRASEGLVKKTKLSDYRVISFATHGLVSGDLNGLTQPALALSAPDVADDLENDGLLTMNEILGLELDADWVVLSACNTGAGEGAGAEAVSGLGRAFFYAGSRALLVSNWPVETTSAKALTAKLFKLQANNNKLGRAEALRQSMFSLIEGPGFIDPESGKIIFSYAHPIFWAPFSLIGDGGAREALGENG